MGLKKYIIKINIWIEKNKHCIASSVAGGILCYCVGFKLFLAIVTAMFLHVIWMRGGE